MAAFAGEVPHGATVVKPAFADAYGRLAAAVARAHEVDAREAEARAPRISVATLVGTLLLARALDDDHAASGAAPGKPTRHPRVTGQRRSCAPRSRSCWPVWRRHRRDGTRRGGRGVANTIAFDPACAPHERGIEETVPWFWVAHGMLVVVPCYALDSCLAGRRGVAASRRSCSSRASTVSSRTAPERRSARATHARGARREPAIQTLGFAGFFGAVDTGLGTDAAQRRAEHLELAAAWKSFKTDALSTFTFVEALGITHAGKLVADSFGLSRSCGIDSVGLSREVDAARKPRLVGSVGPLELEARCELAAGMLRGMSLTHDFARLVLLVGHGSATRNNPHAAGLDCGACCGQTGEVNARVAAACCGALPRTARYGSGNKVLHNVAGGHLGVFEGNGGDLRIGLPMQSLHDGARWVHTPLRLTVFIAAPRSAIDGVLAKHESVRALVTKGWLSLFQLDEQESAIYAMRGGRWIRDTQDTPPAPPAAS